MLRMAFVVFVSAPLASVRSVEAGAFVISRDSYSADPCWCEAAALTSDPITVVYKPGPREECDIVAAAFRLQGVPDDPALNRRFEPWGGYAVTGDPFGDGAIVRGIVYEGPVGYIVLSTASPLPPQVWSVEAHRTLGGVTSAAAAFESAPDVWVDQPGYATRFGSAEPQCDTCAELPPWPGCPFAVEPGTWSLVKRLYQ